MTYQRKTSRISKEWALPFVLLAIVAIIAGLEITGVTNFWGPEIQKTTTRPISSEKNTFSQGSPTTKPTTSKDSQSSGALNLLAPGGAFVSNHKPNLDGSPAPDREQSVCNTTPGASCVIRFEKDGVTKSLPTKVADDNGNTYWTWQLKDLGLNEGQWAITATASLNGGTKDTADSLRLEVGP